ncbi:MAG: hypothetical protein IJO74_00695 [Clostridia bacterium]|nr:hypothetical protein [Clostridia bacterium]
MKKYLLSQNGTFYKANLHCHTTVSDGVLTPEETKKIYKENGYSIVAFTDHDVMVPHPELKDDDFLPLNGYELEVRAEKKEQLNKTCHMCFIPLSPDNLKQVCFHRTKYFDGNGMDYLDVIQFDENEPDYIREYTPECINDMMKKGIDNGFFVTYNHPNISIEGYNEYMKYNHMHAMEVYNSSSDQGGYCEYNEKEYDAMLRGGKRIFCIATDDTHIVENCCCGYTMIKAEKLEYKAITDALLAGNFYASQGPSIYDLWYEDGIIHIDCSDAVTIELHTANRAGCVKAKKDDARKVVNTAEFKLRPEDGYVRLTVTDANGKHANTNAYFIDELFAE